MWIFPRFAGGLNNYIGSVSTKSDFYEDFKMNNKKTRKLISKPETMTVYDCVKKFY
jgi:hypothetical protein